MSVKGCYTDFHIDFGGTSVWYHVFKGCKVSSRRLLLADIFFNIFKAVANNKKVINEETLAALKQKLDLKNEW